MYMFVCFFTLEFFFCKAASNVGPYGLFWQPALVCHTLILYMSLFIGQIKMLACLLACEYNAGSNSVLYVSELQHNQQHDHINDDKIHRIHNIKMNLILTFK